MNKNLHVPEDKVLLKELKIPLLDIEEKIIMKMGKKKIEQDEKVKEFYEMCVENEKKSIEEIFKLFRSLNNKN